MYQSSETVKEFIDRLSATLDISAAPERAFLLRELSALEQLLYSGCILDERLVFPLVSNGEVELSGVIIPDGERTPCADDVFAVFCGKKPLVRTTLYGTLAVSDTSRGYYYRSGEYTLSLCAPDMDGDVSIFYYARPLIKTEANQNLQHIALPDEFLSLAESKIRGEAYKAANEDTLAAKWLGDFNIRLAAFESYIRSVRERVGRVER